MRRARWGERERAGLAIGAAELCASRLTRGGSAMVPVSVRTRPLEPLGSAATTWDDLRDALAELRAALGLHRPIASVSLLPPLAEARRVDLPRLSAIERRRVLTRDAASHFPGITEPMLADGLPVARGGASPMPIFAAAAPARVVEAILTAATEAGWSVAAIAPATAAWAAAAIAQGEEVKARGWVVVADQGAPVQAIRLHEARPVLVRRLGAGASANAVMRVLAGSGVSTIPDSRGPVATIGSYSMLSELRVEFGESNAGERAHNVQSITEGSSLATAATFAGAVRGPSLLPERIHAGRARRENRLALSLMGAAAALLVAAAGMELWGINRELQKVLRLRSELRASVGQVMIARDTLAVIDERLDTLRSADTSSPRWSEVIAGIAGHLPADSHLAAFRASADTVMLEGVSGRAVGVFEAMRGAPGLAGVRAARPIQRDLASGQPDSERFLLAARIAPLTPDATPR